jgi:hypothetical protein
MDSAVSQLGDTAKSKLIELLSIEHTKDNQIQYDPVWIKDDAYSTHL